ncbi:MAG: sugar transferase [Desulforhopalus sp.]|nr:sugar transferase [Desulforhopalus sp.]
MKRFFDLCVSLLVLVLLAPLFIVVIVVIRTTSLGPAFFRQVRVGLNGKKFFLYKFRTMRTIMEAEQGRFDAGDTSRVTTVGRFLRKTKLDEFPQFFNVLKGDMSIVGPRPEIEKWVAVYPERWRHVHTVRPGITDPASIAFRNEEDILSCSEDPERCYKERILPKKLELYEEYVRNQSFGGDLKLIFKTAYTVFCK